MTSSAGKPEWRRSLLAGRRARLAGSREAAREALECHLLGALDAGRFRDVSTAPLLGTDPSWTAGFTESAALSPVGSGATPPTICAYLPLNSEPLPPALPSLLARRGWRVLLPIAVPGDPLDWAELRVDDDPNAPPSEGAAHHGAPHEHHQLDPRLRRSAIGILEPTGPRLGAHAIRHASVVLVPALAVDASGFRLGRGGGFYDRSMALLDETPSTRAGSHGPGSPATPRPGVIRDAEQTEPAARPATIAIVFDDEWVDALPHEPHDVRVEYVATPTGGLRPIDPARDTA